MNNATRRLISETVKARAAESAAAGLVMNAEMRRREEKRLKARVVSGDVSDEDMRAYLQEDR